MLEIGLLPKEFFTVFYFLLIFVMFFYLVLIDLRLKELEEELK